MNCRCYEATNLKNNEVIRPIESDDNGVPQIEDSSEDDDLELYVVKLVSYD